MVLTNVTCFALAAAAIALVIGTEASADSAKAVSFGAHVDQVFSEWNKPSSPGCAVGVFRNGKIAYERGYGMASLEHGVPITPDTVFYIASVSKEFTAAAVALLAEEGRISLDDDIRKYVPEIPAYERPITVRNLIHHTSGLRDYLLLWHESGRSHVDSIPESEAIALIARQDGLEFTPGSQFKYSNSGYFLLSMIVKRASGMPLSGYAEKHIFKPLGMNHTHFRDDRTRIVPHRASAYFRREGSGEKGLGLYLTSYDLVGDGGLLTTVRDFYLWDQNFQHNILGKRGQAFIDELLSTEPLSSGTPSEYAFGLMLRDYKGMKTVGHGGSFLAFNADYIHVPDLAVSVVALCNQNEIRPDSLTRQIVDIVSNEQHE
jgi:CubicO group peptidase (beta-lactamase class C family)